MVITKDSKVAIIIRDHSIKRVLKDWTSLKLNHLEIIMIH